MGVQVLFNAQTELNGLMTQTVYLIRIATQVQTMKNLIRCYDILDLTNEINKPWDQPGYIRGDLAAFVDLEVACQDLILKKDPSPELVSDYVFEMTRFTFHWKKGMENRFLLKNFPSRNK
jgi:hypothetical protein